MIDKGIPDDAAAWPDGVLQALVAWEQCDVVVRPPLFYYADAAKAIWHPTTAYQRDYEGPELIEPDEPWQPQYGMVTTQTCDIAEEGRSKPLRPWVQIAPVYEVTTWKKNRLRRGGIGYWLLIPDLPGPNPWVADLRVEVPVEKGWLAGQQRIEGFTDEGEKRGAGSRIADLRGRIALAAELDLVRVSLIHATDELARDDEDAYARLVESLMEIGIYADSLLSPTRVQLVAVVERRPDAQSESWLQDRRAEFESESTAAMDVLPLLVRPVDDMTAREYRELSIIWRW